MARDQDGRRPSYHYYAHQLDQDDNHHDDDDNDHQERRHRRRHRSRDHNDPSALRQERRERRERRDGRPTDHARRQAELDIDELRAQRVSYFDRTESEKRRDQERMAHEIRADRAREKPRSRHREPRRDGSRRVEKRKTTEDDRSSAYVYGRPKSRGQAEEITVSWSSVPRPSDEGGSASRTAYTPRSGSASTPSRRINVSNLSRSVSSREPSKGYMATRSSLRRAGSTKTPGAPPAITRSQSTRDPRRSTGGLLSSFFKPPRPTTVTGKEVPRVDCLVCMNDDLPIHKTVKLACGHRMCHSCLKRQFTLSVQDPQHMPPRCCTSQHIPLRYAERLFDDKFKILWNKKYEEYTTSNRLYCPNKGCGQWIKPSKIRMDLTYGRKYARCSACSTKVCVLCNSKFHTRRECPKDEETNRLVEMAKEKGWQRCYKCRAVVELKEGCNHMTCRCSAQFCMVCAAPWKTCSCPWFNYQHIPDEGDRLNDMQVPYTPRQQTFEVVEVIEEPSPPLARRSSTRNRRQTNRNRSLEDVDQGLSAHLRAQLHLHPTPVASKPHRADPVVEVYSLGNAGGHHMNESYAIRSLPTSAARSAARAAASRPSVFGSRRSVREASVRTSASVAATAAASTMAGLSKDGKKVGANRVGTWLDHVLTDCEAIETAPKDVEVDEWKCDGTLIGID